MQKNKSFLAFITVLAMASSLGFSNLFQKLDFQAAINLALKEAKADHCAQGLEITAGEINSISVEGDAIFGGSCIPALVSNGNGVTFNSVFSESGTCSNGVGYSRYVTTQYDARNVSVAFPTPMSFSIETLQDSGGECTTIQSSVEITVMPAAGSGDFNINCTPASTTISAGSSTSFNLSTTSTGGFNSPINFSSSMSPNSGTLPVVSFTNNNRVPPAITTANVSTTVATTAATYIITFTATGGSITKQCNVQLTVNPSSGEYILTLTPETRSVIKGSDAVFNVTATCNGGVTGPITNLVASSPYANLTYNFSNTTVACGATVTLTVGNTGNINANQLSTPEQVLMQSVTVSGQGNN